MTWEGSDPTLSSILLNSHTDVVPVDESKWDHDPFEAFKDENGNIYARGSQDMKCVGIQHLEAVHRAMEQGFRPLRTIHLTFVPDEEIGGHEGMKLFVETKLFSSLNVGFALDEGLASPEDVCIAYYGERAPWWILAETTGVTGHGSQLFKETAVDRLLKFLHYFVDMRNKELEKLPNAKLGDVTSVNINMIKSGAFSSDGSSWQTNIIPSSAQAAIDIRITPNVDISKFENDFVSLAQKLNIKISYLQSTKINPITNIDPLENSWWNIFQKTCSDANLNYEPAIFPAATDSRYIRRKGIPAIGFSPMNNTQVLLHDHNEYLNEQVFIKGIDFFTELIKRLSSKP